MAASATSRKPRLAAPARRLVRDAIVLALLYAAGLAAVWGLSLLGVSTLTVFPVFVLGVLIASLETDSGLCGAVLGVAYLLSYDFLFTAPVMELKVLSRTDVVALAVFLAVALIMGVITHRMSRQLQEAERLSRALGQLGRLATGLYESATPQEACRVARDFLAPALGRDVAITLGEPGPDQPAALGRLATGLYESATPQEACRVARDFLAPALGRDVAITLGEPGPDQPAAARECFEQRSPTGYGEPGGQGREKYLPLGMKGRVLGVVAVDCSAGDVGSASLALVSLVTAQVMTALERNELAEGREEG